MKVNAEEGVFDVGLRPISGTFSKVLGVFLIRHGESIRECDVIEGFEVVGESVPGCYFFIVGFLEHFVGWIESCVGPFGQGCFDAVTVRYKYQAAVMLGIGGRFDLEMGCELVYSGF
jgi:hypothetical protein